MDRNIQRDEGMCEYERITYEVKYYAELGYCDGGGVGYWVQTKESIPFPTKDQAHEYLKNHADTEVVNFGSGFTEVRPKWGYGLARVRRAEEPVKDGNKNMVPGK